MSVVEINTDQVIRFTDSALEELSRLKSTLELAEDQYLRIGVKGGG
jgi:Fe-S cluster assembly iron-binding protein IscA